MEGKFSLGGGVRNIDKIIPTNVEGSTGPFILEALH